LVKSVEVTNSISQFNGEFLHQWFIFAPRRFSDIILYQFFTISLGIVIGNIWVNNLTPLNAFY
jgi:hypothetical protein